MKSVIYATYLYMPLHTECPVVALCRENQSEEAIREKERALDELKVGASVTRLCIVPSSPTYY
jgi:hypothetical protein